MAINSEENKTTSNTQCRVGPSTVVITPGGAVEKSPNGRAVLDSGVRWPGPACHALPENRRAHPNISNMIKLYSLHSLHSVPDGSTGRKGPRSAYSAAVETQVPMEMSMKTGPVPEKYQYNVLCSSFYSLVVS